MKIKHPNLKRKTVTQFTIYDLLKQMKEQTSDPLPGMTDEEWDESFVEHNGRQEDLSIRK
jgi:hypothetical protein